MNKILVIDDDRSIRTLFAEELAEEGYEVITSGDGYQPLGLIAEKNPDLIVLDICLGEHDGLELLQDIRNAHPSLPVILCTAYPFFRNDLRSTAADHYVVKSADLGNLKEKIEAALHKDAYLSPAATHLKSKESQFIPDKATETSTT
jgi:DNA-binding response OmpR family regulator